MEEEVIAKSVRTMYIILYPIIIVFGAVFLAIGAFMAFNLSEDLAVFSWILCFLGIALVVASIVWLVYFCKMPKNAVTFKDGKLYFRNGTVCSPTEVDSVQAKFMSLDGEIFNFGKLFVTVRGVQFKLKYVANALAAANRIYMLKAEYSVKEHIEQNRQTDAAEENKLTEENNG